MKGDRHTDPYEEADGAATRAGVHETAWRLITEIGRFSKKESVPPTKNEISEAMGRVHGHYSDISYHLRKSVKSDLVVKVGVSTSGGVTYGLTAAGSRLLGFECPIYTGDGPAELNLARTKVALEVSDALNAEYHRKINALGDTESLAFLGRVEAAEKAVGEAFALDTADRNNHDVAAQTRPGPWLRRLVEEYGGS